MKNLYILLTLLLLLTAISCDKSNPSQEQNNETDSSATDSITADTNTYYQLVSIETDWGNMLIWLYDETPIHKAHFINMIEDSFFNGQIFNRIVRNFVIQGGCPDTSAIGHINYPVEAEFDSNITHVYGALGMGRYGEDVNPDKLSNGCQIYLITDTAGEHQLDMDYTVFGILADGFQTLDDLNRIPTGFNSSEPKDTTVYMSISLVEKSYSELNLLSNFNIETIK